MPTNGKLEALGYIAANCDLMAQSPMPAHERDELESRAFWYRNMQEDCEPRTTQVTITAAGLTALCQIAGIDESKYLDDRSDELADREAERALIDRRKASAARHERSWTPEQLRDIAAYERTREAIRKAQGGVQ